MSQECKTPAEWYAANRKSLKQYRGQWIAYTKDGVISHHQDYRAMKEKISSELSNYVIERIFENEFVDPIRFLPVRFRTVKKHEWQPKYEVLLKGQNEVALKMLVDSGADFCLIPKQLGIDLGYTQGVGEISSQAQGVGGSVDYLLRTLEIEIDSHRFTAPAAWVQNEECQEVILGREVVFDLFDIEFKQAEETILFKFRSA